MFEKVKNPIDNSEIEIFEGTVDFVSVKEHEPDRYQKTHRVSLCVDSDANGKNGVWLACGSFDENRIRMEGRAISLQADGQWYDVCKGYKIRVPVKRNGDWINPVLKNLVIVESVDTPAPAKAANTGVKGNYTPKKKDNTGVLQGHAQLGGAELVVRFGMDYDEACEFYHDVSRRVVDRYREENGLGLDEYSVGAGAGNAVNVAVKLIEKAEDLEKYANAILYIRAPKLREYILNGEKSKEETPVKEKVDESSLQGSPDDVAF